MRFYKPELETKRIHQWFAIIPVTIDNETRWLERVEVEQIYINTTTPSGEPEPNWYNLKFINQ